MVRDVDNAERLLDFAEVVSHPGESAGEVLDVRAKEDGKRLAIATRVQDTFIAIGESDFELVDGAIGEVGELEGSGASAIAQELFEGEATLGRLDDAEDLLRMEAEFGSGAGERAYGGVGFDYFVKALLGTHRDHGFDLMRRSSHFGGLYHGGSVATAGDAGGFSTGALTHLGGEVLQLFSQVDARFSGCA